jgi:hypothetical protein
MGRRLSTAVFDFLAWSIPCLIWAFAEDFWLFLGAALLNGTMRITSNSWDCLMVEDAPREKITQIYSLVIIAGHLSALFAPIASILVSRLTMVPAVRILYINAFVIMTIKLLLLYFIGSETQTGLRRQRETKGKSIFSLVGGYGGVLKLMVSSPGTIFAIAISAIIGIVGMVNTAFWQVIVSKKIGVADELLPFFPMLRSALAILFFFTIISRMSQLRLKRPLLAGFACYFVGQGLLMLVPAGAGAERYAMLCVSLLFDAFAMGILAMLAESLVAIHVDPEERARVLGLLQMTVMLLSAPFGWIAGALSDVSRNYPFALNLVMIVLGIVATLVFYGPKLSVQQKRTDESTAQ